MLISYLPKGKLIASFFYTLLSFILFIPSVIYLGYYQIYHSFIREIGLLSILATTKSEIINYLTANFSINQIYIAIIGIIVLFFLFFYISYHTARQKCILAIPKKYVFILFIFSCIIFGHVQLHIFPINEYITMHKTNGIIQAYMALRDNIDNNSNEIRIPENAMNTAVKTPGTILIVIGESANRDRMSAFNPSYPENTTPWEATETTNPDFFFPSHAYSNYPNTVMALTQALTNVNQYENEIKLGDSVNIIDVAKKMGYHTYWISTQGKNGIYDGGVTLIAKRAEKAIWNNNKGADDQWLVEQLKLVPKNQNNFIVLHMTGSHFRYSNRYPSSFGEKQIFNSSNNKEYDTSLAYTDTILHSIYEYAQQNLQLQAMVYMSDHGENMKYTHVTNPFYYDMIRIPLWFYLSPQYQTAYPETVQSLRAHRHTVFTNDLLFDTISGLLHSNSNFYLPQNDFTNSKYDLTLKNAKSVNGTIDIADDPGITPAK
jgi:heptose-I-phosphate ethanolaminephosphotransferase